MNYFSRCSEPSARALPSSHRGRPARSSWGFLPPPGPHPQAPGYWLPSTGRRGQREGTTCSPESLSLPETPSLDGLPVTGRDSAGRGVGGPAWEPPAQVTAQLREHDPGELRTALHSPLPSTETWAPVPGLLRAESSGEGGPSNSVHVTRQEAEPAGTYGQSAVQQRAEDAPCTGEQRPPRSQGPWARGRGRAAPTTPIVRAGKAEAGALLGAPMMGWSGVPLGRQEHSIASFCLGCSRAPPAPHPPERP